MLSVNGNLSFVPNGPNTVQTVYYKIMGGANELHNNQNFEVNPAVGMNILGLFIYKIVFISI